MPALGLGTFQATAPGEVGAAVKAAIRAGYRLIDCAAGYGNQKEIGEALAEVFAEGTVQRSDLFIVSKLFQTHHVWEGDDSRCHETLSQTLADLRLDYLDLFLIHWPFAFGEKKLEKPPGTPQPLRLPDGSPNPIWSIKMEYTQTWKVMENFVNRGQVRSIGVSNFTTVRASPSLSSRPSTSASTQRIRSDLVWVFAQAQLDHLRSVATIPPAVNQVELHPYFQQQEMVAYCAAHRIAVMGYSPLGSSADRFPAAHGTTLLNHPTIRELARAAGKTAGQVLIRFGLQRYPDSLVSIPKSSNADRIAQNFDVDFELSAEAMRKIAALESGFRYVK